MSYKAINAYQKDSLKQQVADADPHKLTLMLMSGAVERLAYAKGAIDRKDMESKSKFIAKAIAIVINLRDTIDMSVNEAFANNLFSLYDYMIENISQANISNDVQKIDEVLALLIPIKDAWAAIPRAEIERAYHLGQEDATKEVAQRA